MSQLITCVEGCFYKALKNKGRLGFGVKADRRSNPIDLSDYTPVFDQDDEGLRARASTEEIDARVHQRALESGSELGAEYTLVRLSGAPFMRPIPYSITHYIPPMKK